MNLATVVDELYGLPPRRFTSVRDTRASEASATGDRDLASSIKKLRKPSTGAWMANSLARGQSAQIDRLIDLGESLRSARNPDGERIREASKVKADSVARLLRQARTIAVKAGEPVSQAAEQDLESTLDAAFADPKSAAALREGCLTGALRYSGLGFEAGVQTSRSRGSGGPKEGKPVPGTSRPVERARTALKEATREAEQADIDLEAARRAVIAGEADLKRLRAGLTVAERRAAKARKNAVAARKKVDTLSRSTNRSVQ